jgi:3-deoxy-D-manno-octulosonic-acid transferase
MSNWRETLALAAYSLLLRLGTPLLWLKLQRRARQEPLYGQGFAERMGFYRDTAQPGAIWVHAVSLGETRAAAVLITALRQALPGMRLLLTHGTATGREEGQKLLQPGDLQVWQPWDTPGGIHRFLRHFQPRLGVLMETELWPNLIHGCQTVGLPLALVNARMSERSERKALRLGALSRPAYAALSSVWAQTTADAERLTNLGARVAGVLGNLKFDATPHAGQLLEAGELKKQCPKPVLLLASSREGEEALFLQALATLPRPWTFWPLIVPRHPQRFDEVAQWVRDAGHSLGYRVKPETSMTDNAEVDWLQSEFGLGNSLGEMALYFGLADIALLGGSFAPLGGQNLIEAATCGCPIVMGPHTFNFAQASEQALLAGAAWRAVDMNQAIELAIEKLQHSHELANSRQQALAFAQAHRGATQATAKGLLTLLENHAGPAHNTKEQRL